MQGHKRSFKKIGGGIGYLQLISHFHLGQSKSVNGRKHSFSSQKHTAKGAFPPSHFCNKLDDKLTRKVALVSL
jgi:hypothetical protein